MEEWILKDPHWLWLLVILPLLWWLRSRGGAEVLVVPSASQWKRHSFLSQSGLPVLLFYTAVVLLIFGLARPQKIHQKIEVQREGYDIMMAIDLSSSMLAEDYKRNGVNFNRLQMVKPVVKAFIRERRSDRIGLVVFGKNAYTVAPLTFDRDWLIKQTDRLDVELVEDGTAIGDALGLALQRLELKGRNQGVAEGKDQRLGAFVVLLTDGYQTAGTLKPRKAAEVARKYGIPIYTIGAGREGEVPFPLIQDGLRVGTITRVSRLDEKTLRDVAEMTDGEFYRAEGANAIERAFASIDKKQKIKFEADVRLKADEYFEWLVWPGAVLLSLSLLLIRSKGSGSIQAAMAGGSK
ncbi:MAG: VWA domain-containing protein [Verrucomicrobiota bacterium]